MNLMNVMQQPILFLDLRNRITGPDPMQQMPLTGLGLALTLMLLTTMGLRAQHEQGIADEPARHEVAVLLAHTHVAQGVNADGQLTWLALPSWGLNYNYWLSPHWAVGLHTDLINETFRVEENLLPGADAPTVQRTRPNCSGPDDHLPSASPLGLRTGRRT
jgi:hypothetical protein